MKRYLSDPYLWLRRQHFSKHNSTKTPSWSHNREQATGTLIQFVIRQAYTAQMSQWQESSFSPLFISTDRKWKVLLVGNPNTVCQRRSGTPDRIRRSVSGGSASHDLRTTTRGFVFRCMTSSGWYTVFDLLFNLKGLNEETHLHVQYI